MRIDHVAIFTRNLEKMKAFYEKFFLGKSNIKYVNEKKSFESYFLTFDDGARLELMSIPSIVDRTGQDNSIYSGYTHVAFSVGTKEKVDQLTQVLQDNSYKIISGPRVTGDGYYESCFYDPDGNIVEITADNF